MHQNARKVADRIEGLSPEQIAEVEDFIDFLRFRAQEHEIARATAAVSEPAFHAVWNNPEDDAYDAEAICDKTRLCHSGAKHHPHSPRCS